MNKCIKYKYCIIIAMSLILISTGSCKKFIVVEAPVTSINAANVYTTDATAISALTGIYATMSNATLSGGGIASMSLFPALSADELTLYNYPNQTPQQYGPYYLNALTSLNTNSPDFWNKIYPLIFDANAAIEGLSNSEGLTPSIQQQLLGEAKFIRAFCYFYLVNLYGDVPLVLSTDYNVNRLLARTPRTTVWQQIIIDLKDAQNLLVSGYVGGDLITATTERTTPNKWAATALLARAYLYTTDWQNAEIQASNVINNATLFGLDSLNNVFLKSTNNRNEAIWQLQSVATSPTVNTSDAYLFILPAAGPNTSGTYPVYLSNYVVNSFEVGDKRKTSWASNVTVSGAPATTYYYPNKYKSTATSGTATEYRMVLRLGEQYLIRAEARAQQNKDLAGAQADLNAIRARAWLGPTPATTQAALLTAILHERQVELFTEWGHRWLDLKRTNTVDAVMNVVSPTKGGSWNTNWQWYPIPNQSMQTDPNLIQNSGYN